MRLAFFGGIYNNHLALSAAIADARSRGADAMWCLGDLGAFGPHPDRTCELIRDNNISVVQGNYDHSIGHGLNDCQCGYTDSRDNYFAQLSYDYTLAHTSDEHRAWMRTLPPQVRLEIDDVRLLLCHGSPRRTNEFLWESTTSTQFLDKLCDDFDADMILGTHTGLHWQCLLRDGRRFINVGVLGRPENDGTTNVWYALLKFVVPPFGGTEFNDDHPDRLKAELRTGARRSPLHWEVEFVPLAYDHERLAREMRDERLPNEFIETILTGWWTTCLEVLPSKERRRGRW